MQQNLTYWSYCRRRWTSSCLFLAFRPSTFLQRKIRSASTEKIFISLLLCFCDIGHIPLCHCLITSIWCVLFAIQFHSVLYGDAEYGDSFNVLHNAPFFRFVLLHFLILFLDFFGDFIDFFFQSQSFLYLRKLVINSLMSRPAEWKRLISDAYWESLSNHHKQFEW